MEKYDNICTINERLQIINPINKETMVQVDNLKMYLIEF